MGRGLRIVNFFVFLLTIVVLTSASHPLDPLSSNEIEKTVQIIEKSKESSSIQYTYNYIALQEPPKSVLLPNFISGRNPPRGIYPRKAFLILQEKTTGEVYEAVVNLDTSRRESYTHIENVRAPFTPRDLHMDDIDIVLADRRVQKRCAALGYPDMSLVTGLKLPFHDPQPKPETRRWVEYFLFGKNFPADNFHAHPLDFTTIYDLAKRAVVAIQNFPTHSDASTNNTGNIAPHGEANYEYQLRGGKGFLRQDDKPIRTKSPKGVSYKVNGNEIQWQKWKMRVGFNGREGPTLHMVSYNDGGKHRPIIYRASLSELFVPYGDGRHPFYRTVAMDVGESGLGYYVDSQTFENAIGPTTFLNAYLHTSKGVPAVVQNAINIREEDAGILWKHINFRTGKGVVTRSHRLVISATMTANNYDYSFAWKFYQDGSIQFETLLLGILYTTMVAAGSPGGESGTLVAPQVAGQFHQHFFTVRMDIDLEQGGNSVSTLDVIPLPGETGSRSNPYGQGFTTNTTLLRTASQGRSRIDPLKARTWVVTNPNVKNSVTNKPVGWKLMPSTMPPPLRKIDSPYRSRSEWVEHDVWVTPYKEDFLFPDGLYLNNSGLVSWVSSNPEANIENTDVVLWHTFGVCHITRPEDYPIMPVETAGFWFKPYNFFEENPAIDVPPPSTSKVA